MKQMHLQNLHQSFKTKMIVSCGSSHVEMFRIVGKACSCNQALGFTVVLFGDVVSAANINEKEINLQVCKKYRHAEKLTDLLANGF